VADLGGRYRDLVSRLGVVRGRGAYGRKPNRAVLNEIAKDGPVTVFHEDRSTGDVVIETAQNVAPVLAANAADYTSGHDGYTPSRDMRKVASIPLVEVHRLMREDGISIFDRNDWPKIAAKLDDPNWIKFRTAPGRISKRPNREYFSASTSGG